MRGASSLAPRGVEKPRRTMPIACASTWLDSTSIGSKSQPREHHCSLDRVRWRKQPRFSHRDTETRRDWEISSLCLRVSVLWRDGSAPEIMRNFVYYGF